MMVVFVTLVTAGQALFALGVSLHDRSLGVHDTKSWYVMWAGRVLFGLGGESMTVAQSTFIVEWFKGKELAFALGANIALARLGSVANDALAALFHCQKGGECDVQYAMWLGFLICIISMLCVFAAVAIDYYTEKRIKKSNDKASERLLAAERGSDAAILPEDDAEATDDVNLGDVLKFQGLFWVLCLSCVSVYCAVLPFNNIASDFISYKWLVKPGERPTPATEKHANNLMAIIYLVSGVLSPVMGGVIDRIGMRAVVATGAAGLVAAVHAVMGLSTLYPLVPLILLGVAYSFYAAALWPSVAYVVDEKSTGTAYGVITAVQNIGLASVPLIVSAFNPTSADGYTGIELMFAGFGGLGVVCGIVMNVMDMRGKGALNKVHTQVDPDSEHTLMSPTLLNETPTAIRDMRKPLIDNDGGRNTRSGEAPF
jgi:MFS family permease